MIKRRFSIAKWWSLAGLVLLTSLMSLEAVLADGDDDDVARCSILGSWYGYLPTYQIDALVTAHGASEKRGTYTLEVPGLNLALFGFTDVTNMSSLRGTWERIDKRTFSVTVVGYAVDSFGHTLVIGKISDIDTISEDCNSINIQSATELFAPGQDPFGDEPPAYGWFFGAPHSISRMRVDSLPTL